MTIETTRPVAHPAWQVTRHFDGGKGTEELLRALIQAHKPHIT